MTIIRGKDGDSHLAKLEAVLLKLRKAGLKAKLTKCEFLKLKITFLGHTLDGDGIHTMDDKISAKENFPHPQNLEKVWSFLGLCGYYRPFIRGFARTVSTLTQLLRKEVKFNRNAPQDKNFNDLKSALINAPPWHSRTIASLFLYIQMPPP